MLFAAATASPLVLPVLWAASRNPWQALGLIPVIALAWRRTAVTAAAVVVAASTVPTLLVTDGRAVAVVATPVMLYSVLARGDRRTARGFTVLVVAGTIASIVQWQEAEGWIGPAVVFVVALTAAAFLGLLRRLVLARREARNERDRQVTALAVSQERGRIAREVHDIVAHSLAVMIAQAEAARLTVDDDPAGAGQRMSAVADNGRRALGDIREALRALRDGPDGPDAAGPRLTPRPTLERVADLADAARAAGLATRLEAVGSRPAGLTQAWQLAVHRIVQEALTNVLKHAGGGVRVVVRLEWRLDQLRITVTDSGGAAPVTAAAGSGTGGNGMGVTGMRERIRAFGGTLTAGPRVGGGWQVLADIPYVSVAALRSAP